MDIIHDSNQLSNFSELTLDGQYSHEIFISVRVGREVQNLTATVKTHEQVVAALEESRSFGEFISAWIGLNPLKRKVAPLGKVRSAKTRHPNSRATTDDVALLRFVFEDHDHPSKGKYGTTADELAESIQWRDRSYSVGYTDISGDPMEPCYIGVTGNGSALIYRLPDLPNTPENRRLVKDAFLSKAAIAGVHIDTVTFDAPRLFGVPGTVNATRLQDENRPHRLRTGTVNVDARPVPVETLERLAALRPKPSISTNTRPAKERNLTSEEVSELVNIISPFWQDGVRHNFGLAVSGLLYKMGAPIEQAESVIAALSQGDQDPQDRLAALEDTYKRGASGDTIAWHEVLSSAMPLDSIEAISGLWQSIERRTAPVLILEGAASTSEHGAAPFSDDQFAIRNGVHCQYIQTKSKDAESDQPDGYWKPLTNFACWVESNYMHPENRDLDYAEVVMTDANGVVHGPIAIPLSKFRRPDEWISFFGTWPRIYPRVHRDVILNAIQSASGDTPVVVTYARLGWVETRGTWSYLTPSGALSSSALDTSIRVEPGGRLAEVQVQWPEDEEALKEAVRAVLSMPTAISNNTRGKHAAIAVLSAALRAPLIPARRVGFILQIVGETGAGKSALAGLAASLYSPKFKYDHHIGGWHSTENAILSLASRATHVFMNMDEYHETGATPQEAKATASKHANVVYAVANDGGRNRLNRDGTPNDAPEIATMMASTQEHDSTSTSASGRGRTVTVSLEKRGKDGADLNLEALIQFDRQYARNGLLNLALSGFIRSLAGQMDTLLQQSEHVHDMIATQVRRSLAGAPVHERTVPNIADLAIGWDTFISYAFQTGAINEHEMKAHQEDLVLAFTSLAHTQAHEQQIEQPERVIIELLQEAFDSRVASLRWKDTDGVPEDATRMGWREYRRNEDGCEYQPARSEIGWVDRDNVYLLPRATSGVIAQMSRATQVTVPAGERQLGLTLQRAGIALEGNEGRPTRKVGVGNDSRGGRSLKRCIVIPREIIFEVDNVTVFPNVADARVDLETGEIA